MSKTQISLRESGFKIVLGYNLLVLQVSLKADLSVIVLKQIITDL